MNKTILLATIAVLLVAGCTTPQGFQWPFQQITMTTIGGAGMVMTDFSPYLAGVSSGQTNKIFVTVSNMGGFAVPDADSLVYLTGSAINLTTGADQSLYWTSTTETSLIKKLNKDPMKPADPINDIPADEKQIYWSLKAPNVSVREQKSYLFIGRVYYDYQTKVTGNMWVYSDTEADAAKAASKSLNKATFTSTSGPVAITAKLTQDPVVLYSGEDSVTLSLRISSVGGGVLYKQGVIDYSTTDPNMLNLTADQINKVDIGIKLAGVALSNDCTGEKELIGGKELPLTCDITVDRPATFSSLPIEITANYGYYQERTATVTVSGR